MSCMQTVSHMRRETKRKKLLQISHMDFAVCGEVFDEYGDGCYRELQFTLDRKEHAVWLRQGDETAQVTLTIKEMRKLLNVIVNNYEIFCWEEDYGTSDTDCPLEDDWDEEEGLTWSFPMTPKMRIPPSWEVSICYLNGETQDICGYDDLPTG